MLQKPLKISPRSIGMSGVDLTPTEDYCLLQQNNLTIIIGKTIHSHEKVKEQITT